MRQEDAFDILPAYLELRQTLERARSKRLTMMPVVLGLDAPRGPSLFAFGMSAGGS